jgi:hypothetical protein
MTVFCPVPESNVLFNFLAVFGSQSRSGPLSDSNCLSALVKTTARGASGLWVDLEMVRAVRADYCCWEMRKHERCRLPLFN